MSQAPASLVLLLAAAALLCLFVAGWSLTLRRQVPIEAFAALMVCIGIYTVGSAVELSEQTAAGMLSAIRFEYVGLSFIPPLMLVVALQLVWQRRVPSLLFAALLVIPVITLGMVFTTPMHDLFYVDPRAVDGGSFPVLEFERGPWYLLNFAQQAALVITATVYLLRFALRVRRELRWATTLIAVAATLPVAVSLLYFLGWRPLGIDPVPLFLGLSGVLIAISLLGLNLLDLIPTARALALDRVSIALLVMDAQGVVRDCNDAARQLPGMSALAVGKQLPAHNPLGGVLTELAAEPGRSSEFSVPGPESGTDSDETRYYQAMSYPVSAYGQGARGVALVVQDISETQSKLVRLTEQASTDALTGALTRRAITHRARQVMRDAHLAGSPVALLMVDMDRFKAINDRFGHATGDEALAMACHQMRSVLRAQDLLGRWGGDEFVLVLPDAGPASAMQVARRLQGRLRGLEPQRVPYSLLASVGIATGVPGPEDDVDSFMALADEALYRAKERGESQVELTELTRV